MLPNWNHVIKLTYNVLFHFRYQSKIPSICRPHAQGNGFFMLSPIDSFCTGGAKYVTLHALFQWQVQLAISLINKTELSV